MKNATITVRAHCPQEPGPGGCAAAIALPGWQPDTAYTVSSGERATTLAGMETMALSLVLEDWAFLQEHRHQGATLHLPPGYASRHHDDPRWAALLRQARTTGMTITGQPSPQATELAETARFEAGYAARPPDPAERPTPEAAHRQAMDLFRHIFGAMTHGAPAP